MGIVGSNPLNTPGKDLRESKGGKEEAERHLTVGELTYYFGEIMGRNNWKSLFRTHNVFALDSAKTLEMVLKAREDATN